MTVREITFGSDEYHSACELRQEVLRSPLGLRLEDEDREMERNQWHFALFDEGDRLVACVTVVPFFADQTSKLRQMAVSPAVQGRGLGKRLMIEVERILLERGLRRIVLHARAAAEGFYSRLGYAAEGGFFTEVTLPHLRMIKEL